MSRHMYMPRCTYMWRDMYMLGDMYMRRCMYMGKARGSAVRGLGGAGVIFGAFTGRSQDLQAAVTDRCGNLAGMDNMHQPPDGDPQDYRATQDLGPAGGQPGQGPGWGRPAPEAGWGQPGQSSGPGQPGQGSGWGQAGPGSGWGQPPGTPGGGAGGNRPSGAPRRRSRAVWWGSGLALVALLGGGLAAAELAGNASPATGPTGQAAALNTMLNSASSPASAAAADSAGSPAANPAVKARCQKREARLNASGHSAAAQAVQRFCGHPVARIRALGGIHGQFTFETKSGARTIAYERGVVKSVSGNDVVVQAKDGTTWTWVLQSNSVIRQDGKKVATSALSTGESVFAGGPVVSGSYDARLIVIRPASGGAAPSPSSSPSSSSSS
jgi:hypothetical protein